MIKDPSYWLERIHSLVNGIISAGRLSVTTQTYTGVASGELAGSATAVQMPDIACKLVKFKARYVNTGKVYIGGAGVTVPNGVTDTTSGLSLNPGEESGWIPIDNLSRLYRICDSANDHLTYLSLS